MIQVNSNVYDQLRRKIFDEQWGHDEPLIPSTLAEEFGTSRAPVREALQLLSQEGLIRPVRRGYVLRKRSNEEMLELFEARAEIDVLLASYAAKRATTVDLAVVEEAQAESERSRSDDEVRDALRLWHAAVRKAGKNRVLKETADRYDEQIQFGAPWQVKAGKRTIQNSIEEHAKVLSFLRAGDAVGVRDAMNEHHRRDREERLGQLVRQQLRAAGHSKRVDE